METHSVDNPSEDSSDMALQFAAEQMDWAQVLLNGGPPCFALMPDRGFCGRAEAWEGHNEDHRFVSLADLIRRVPPPASTPANPPKEGHSAPLGEQIGEEIYDCLISSLPQGRETFAKQVAEIITAAQQGTKSRWSRREGETSCVPNIDTQRLDWLDAQNQRLNQIHGTQYGWHFSVNHNRVALMDHHFPPLTVREAIDAAMASTNPPAEE